MNLLPLTQKLEDDGLGVQGESIFINMIPAECPTGILLRNPLQGTPIDYELPGYYKTSFQLIVRTASYTDGEALINSAIESLTVVGKSIGDSFFHYSRPKTLPVSFPLSKGNLLEFSVNFDVAFVV